MTLTFTFDKAVGIDIPDGGTLRWAGEGEVPETMGHTRTGAVVGPLEFAIPPDGELEAEEIEFLPGAEEDDDGWSLPLLTAAGAAGVGVASTESGRDQTRSLASAAGSTPLKRRSVLAVLGAIAGGLVLSAPARGEDDPEELVTLSVATIDVTEVTTPYSIRVLDRVDHVLPATTDVLIDQSGSRVGATGGPDERLDMQPATGEVRVYVRDSLGNLARLIAWARSLAEFDDRISYSRTFPNGRNASDYDPGEIIRITEHPAITGAVDNAGARATRMTIGNTDVPHVDNGTSEVGAWDVLGDAIIFEVGESPPAEPEWTIETRLPLNEQVLS